MTCGDLGRTARVALSLRSDRLVLDGEAILLDAERRPHPFQETMSRVGTHVPRETSVVPWFFGCLHAGGNRIPSIRTIDPAEASDSLYQAGRRGKTSREARRAARWGFPVGPGRPSTTPLTPARTIGAAPSIADHSTRSTTRRQAMQRWTLEMAQFVILAVLAFGLHGVIRRSGERYAADVFEGSPGTGRTFLVLADIGYYLIFAAYTLFNLQFEAGRASAKNAEEVVYSIAGVALIIGILHVVNIVALPFMARMLAGREANGTGDGASLRGKLGELQVVVTLNGPRAGGAELPA